MRHTSVDATLLVMIPIRSVSTRKATSFIPANLGVALVAALDSVTTPILSHPSRKLVTYSMSQRIRP